MLPPVSKHLTRIFHARHESPTGRSAGFQPVLRIALRNIRANSSSLPLTSLLYSGAYIATFAFWKVAPGGGKSLMAWS